MNEQTLKSWELREFGNWLMSPMSNRKTSNGIVRPGSSGSVNTNKYLFRIR